MDKPQYLSSPFTNEAKFGNSPMRTSNSPSTTLTSSMIVKEDSDFKDPKRIQSLLVAEIDHLNQENEALIRQMDLLKSTGVSERENELENKIQILLAEIERLQASTSRMRGSQVLSERLSVESESRCRFLNSENEHLNQLLSQAVAENNTLSSKILELERLAATKTEEYGTNILYLKHQLERLSDLNEQKDRDIENLKAQMKELKDRFDEQITENAQLRARLVEAMTESEKSRVYEQEVERLSSVVMKQKAEISELMALNNTKSSELEQNCVMLAQLEQSRQQIAELETKLGLVITENDRLHEVISQKETQLEEFQMKSVEAQVAAEERAQDLKNKLLKYEANDYEGKIRSLVSQNQKLGELLAGNNTELHELQLRVTQLEAEKTQVAAELQQKLDLLQVESDNLRSQVKASEINIKELESKSLHLTSENEKLKATHCEQIQELERQKDLITQFEKQEAKAVADFTQEKERILQASNEAVKEAESLKIVLAETKDELARLKELEDKVIILNEERMKLFEQLSGRNHAMEQLMLKIEECEGVKVRIQQFKEHLAQISDENRRLYAIIAEKDEEIKSLQTISAVLQRKESHISDISDKIDLVAGEYEGFQALLAAKNREIEFLGMKAGLVEDLDLQVKELYTKIQLLSLENEKLNSNLTYKQEEINELKHKMQSHGDLNARMQTLMQEKDNYLQEINTLKTKLNDYLSKHETIMAVEKQFSALEAKHINELETQTALIQELKEREKGIESEKIALISKNEELVASNYKQIVAIESLQLQIKALEKTNEEELESLKASYEQKLRLEMEQNSVKEVETKTQGLLQELEVTKSLLSQKTEEAEKWALKYTQSEELRIKELQVLKGQFESYTKTNIEAEQIKIKFAAERSTYEAQILQLRQLNTELELQLQGLSFENKRLNLQFTEKLQESEDFRHKYFALEDKYRSEISEFKTQIEYFKSSSYDVKQMAIKYSSDRAADQAQIKQLKQMNENYQDELEKLYELINQRKTEYDNLAKQNSELKKRLNQFDSDDKENIDCNIKSKERAGLLKQEILKL